MEISTADRCRQVAIPLQDKTCRYFYPYRSKDLSAPVGAASFGNYGATVTGPISRSIRVVVLIMDRSQIVRPHLLRRSPKIARFRKLAAGERRGQ